MTGSLSFLERSEVEPRMKAVFDEGDTVYLISQDDELWHDKITTVLKGTAVDSNENFQIDCWCYVLEASQQKFCDFGQKLPLFFTPEGAKEDALAELDVIKVELESEIDEIEQRVDKIHGATAVLGGY